MPRVAPECFNRGSRFSFSGFPISTFGNDEVGEVRSLGQRRVRLPLDGLRETVAPNVLIGDPGPILLESRLKYGNDEEEGLCRE